MQPENQDGAFCPGANFSCTDGRVNFEIGRIPTYFSIASCSLSCLSSVLIVVAYLSLREIRMGSQKIITLLAIADFFTASGYLIAAGNFLTHYQHTDLHSCQVFETICEIQSFVTTWSSLCSFVWTCTLALYFYLIVVKNKQRLAVRLLPWENIIAWFIPMLITLPLLVTGRLGYSPYAASNWCFIKDNYQQSLNDHIVTILLIFVGGKFWEIMSYFIVIILYGITRVKFRQMQLYMRQEQQREMSGEIKRLLLIPLLFLALRVWGTIQFFFSMAVSQYNHNGCIPKPIQTVFLVLGVLQGIGDGGQGWGNATLYIFLSPMMCQKLFWQPVLRMLWICGSGLRTIGGKLETIGNRRGRIENNELRGSCQERGGLRNTSESQQQHPQGEDRREQTSNEVTKAEETVSAYHTDSTSKLEELLIETHT